MNEIKRYDQALAENLEHLKMPEEDMAWARMKQLLEEEDDDPVVIPFFRRFGCLLLGLVAALILSIGGWLYYQKNSLPVPASKHSSSTGDTTGDGRHELPVSGGKAAYADTAAAVSPVSPSTTGANNVPAGISPVPGSATQTTDDNMVNGSSGDKASGNKNSFTGGGTRIKITGTSATGNAIASGEGRTSRKNSGASKGKTTMRISQAAASGDAPGGNKEPGKQTQTTTDNNKRDTGITGVNTKDQEKQTATDSLTAQAKKTANNTIAKKDTTVKKQIPPASPAEEKKQKEKQWMLAAGLSVYQPIALNGESAVPYNKYGRKGSLTDYIPSAQLRLYRNKRWFIHTEYRYGAPQSVEPFNYKQEIRDSAQMVWRTIYQLKKTYYHQVPFSFNYYILPGLSVGAGVIYNRFTGAVANRDVFRSGGGTVDTLISSGIIRDRDEKRFVKNHFQWSAETQYQWKRFFIGARYSKDINPYIKFTDISTGAPVEKKAEAFNIFLRYDLWRKKL